MFKDTQLPMLRVRAKSLAEEIRIIHAEERRILRRYNLATERPWLLVNSLQRHRKGLSVSARTTCLAIAFLRGRPYSRAEPRTWLAPDWSEVSRLVLKYGKMEYHAVPEALKAAMAAWIEEAEAYLAQPGVAA